jgi:hypothetical protein
VEDLGVFRFDDSDLVAFSGRLKSFFALGDGHGSTPGGRGRCALARLATAVAISEDPNLSLLQSSSAPIGFGQRVTAGAALDLAK